MLSRIKSLLKKNKESNNPITITPELVEEISTLYAYRLMVKSGNYNDEITYQSNKIKCKEVLGYLCWRGFKLIK